MLEGWKTENGFKIRYLNLLSTYMKQVFPNTDLKPGPHINSRITVWKRNYHSLFEILKNTRVGLDSTTKMIEATDEQWDAFMKKDPNTRLMRSKVGDETQYESQSPSGYAQTGESMDMGKINSGRKRKSPLQPDPMEDDILIDIQNEYVDLHEKLRATTLIARNAKDIDVFFSLPDPDRVEWVKMLLNGEI
ncbi:hypothetical protein ACS0TY_020948 [Phlomoides rotata]